MFFPSLPPFLPLVSVALNEANSMKRSCIPLNSLHGEFVAKGLLLSLVTSKVQRIEPYDEICCYGQSLIMNFQQSVPWYAKYLPGHSRSWLETIARNWLVVKTAKDHVIQGSKCLW
ncbi:hypothetical protein BKA60DRAFT_549939, partial [Fusarium oxysporum]